MSDSTLFKCDDNVDKKIFKNFDENAVPPADDCLEGRENCDPCSDELNQYESDIYTSLIHWFESVTCIPWVREFSEASEPNDGRNFSEDQQYGTIYIQSIDDGQVNMIEDVDIGEIERCKRIKMISDIEVSLNVHNYSRCGLAKSPADILSTIITRYKVMANLRDELCKFGLSVYSWGPIQNVPYEDETVMYQKAQQNISLQVTRYTSISEKLIETIMTDLDCCNN